MPQDDDFQVLSEMTPQEIARRKAYERKVAAVLILCGLGLLALGGSWLGGLDIKPAPSGRAVQKPFFVNPFAAPERTAPGTVPRVAETMDERGYIHTRGVISAIVPRAGLEYVRVIYYMPASGMNCFFHQDVGTDAIYAGYDVSMEVGVVYDPDAADACGTSRIEK